MNKKPLSIFFLFLITFFSNSYANDDFVNYSEYDTKDDFVISEKYSCYEIYDPYERINRKIFMFNVILDAILLKPIAIVYDRKMPPHMKKLVVNFNKNLTMPFTFTNSVLQLDMRNAVSSIWSFLIDSTLGIGGLVDVSKKIGINTKRRTFGSTLARYGAGPGAYIMLPIFGGTNTRDMWDFLGVKDRIDILAYYTNVTTERIMVGVSILEKRSHSLRFEKQLIESADAYALLRSMYHQNRESELHYPSRYICKLKNKK